MYLQEIISKLGHGYFIPINFGQQKDSNSAFIGLCLAERYFDHRWVSEFRGAKFQSNLSRLPNHSASQGLITKSSTLTFFRNNE